MKMLLLCLDTGGYTSFGCSLIYNDLGNSCCYMSLNMLQIRLELSGNSLFSTPKSNPSPYLGKSPKEFKERLGWWQALTSLKTKQTNPSHTEQSQKPNSSIMLLLMEGCLHAAEMQITTFTFKKPVCLQGTAHHCRQLDTPVHLWRKELRLYISQNWKL